MLDFSREAGNPRTHRPRGSRKEEIEEEEKEEQEGLATKMVGLKMANF